MTSGLAGPVEITADGTSYEAALDLTVPAQGSESIYQTQSYTFDAEEAEAEESKVADMLQNSASYFEENQARWDGYLEKIKTADVEQRYKNAGDKSGHYPDRQLAQRGRQMPYGAIQPFATQASASGRGTPGNMLSQPPGSIRTSLKRNCVRSSPSRFKRTTPTVRGMPA